MPPLIHSNPVDFEAILEEKKVISEPVKLDQQYRDFDFDSPWEGTKYIKDEVEKNKTKDKK